MLSALAPGGHEGGAGERPRPGREKLTGPRGAITKPTSAVITTVSVMRGLVSSR